MSSITASEILDNTTAACTAVHPDAFPRTIDEVRESASNAEALRAYARQARNRQLELDAAEIRIRADRRVGKAKGGGNGANQYQHRVETNPILRPRWPKRASTRTRLPEPAP
jgi:hypothetical protein